jgi:outer membrane receptor protein involved in Fe transport
MRIIRTVFLVTLFASGALAQQMAILIGNVQEYTAVQQGVPAKKIIVSGANVTLTSKRDKTQKYGAVTDSSGNFRIEDIPAGEYVLFASRVVARGETASRMEVTEHLKLRQGEQRTENLILLIYIDLACGTRPDCTSIRETVTISADSTQRVDEVSKTVNVITGQEMRDRADFSLAETLRTIPGFRVQQLGGFGHVATIKTRGLRNQDTAILVDGVRLRDASAITGDVGSFLSDLTLTSVSKIEVLRGSGSSLYGTNAIGGTVDFQTPKPQPGFHGQLSVAAGGLGLTRFRGNVSDGTDDGKFGYNLALSQTAYTKGIDGQDNAHNTNFQSRIEYNPFSRTNIPDASLFRMLTFV